MRLLVWNIDKFNIKSLQGLVDDPTAPPPRKKRKGSSSKKKISDQLLADKVYSNILMNVQQLAPDVFGIIEVTASQTRFAGTLVEESAPGAQGLLTLLKYLRLQDPNWCLVPPLKTIGTGDAGSRRVAESVGVFYRSDRLEFIGPNIYPPPPATVPPSGNTAPTSTPRYEMKSGKVVEVPVGDYPAIWKECLPAGSTNPFAAQVDFEDSDGFPIIFGDTLPARAPYYTRFQEKKGADPKTYSILFVHPPPPLPKTKQDGFLAIIRMPGIYVQRKLSDTDLEMASLYEEQSNTKKEVVILAGDFNRHPNQNIDDSKGTPFREFKSIGLNYLIKCNCKKENFSQEICFCEDNGINGGPTIMEKLNLSTPEEYKSKFPADNIFVKYPSGVKAPAKSNARIVDRVAGVPAVKGEPQMPALDSSMEVSLSTFKDNNQWPDANGNDAQSVFMSTMNYLSIRSLTDHFPVVADI